MSQMPQLPQLTACPSCAEPLESGDNFCGGCGADVSSAASPPAQPAAAPPAGAPSAAYGEPSASYGEPPVEPSEEPEDYPLAAPRPPAGTAPADPASVDPGSADPRTAAFAEPAEGGEATGSPSAPHQETPGAPAASGAPAAPGTPPGGATAAAVNTGTGAGRQCAACRAGTIDQDGYCENCGHAQPRARDHMETELTGVAAASDRGLRHHRNEDAFAVSAAALPDGSAAAVAVVCDGVSSATRPDDASAAAAATADALLVGALPRGAHPQQAMRDAILAAAEAVNQLALEPAPAPTPHDQRRQENAPACTIVSAVVAGGILTVGWVGDSRAYWVPDDRTAPSARLTEDDSWAAQMVAAGLMSEEEAYADERAHAITGWLGADAYELDPHTASFKPDRPGVVVVCTDGLWNYAESAEEMATVVPPDARSRPLHSAQVLVDYALHGGGHDNVTVAVLPFPAPPGGAVSA